MAEIQTQDRSNRKRRSTPPRVDLTPMVDLGFLLITFFMLTTTLSEEKRLEVNMPYKPVPPNVQTSFVDTSTITLIPIQGHRIAYYHGKFDLNKEIAVIPINQLRDVITKKQSELKRLPSSYSNNARSIQVLIKPDSSAQYQDLVTTIDEMLINKVETYAIVDVAAAEKEALKDKM